MSLYRDQERLHVPAVAREVYDVSGAGDTVIAVLGVMLAVGAEFAEAVQFANKAAGIVVGKLGTAVVHPEELFS
jgi:D-glycero-beta-D-manno-heptose-7-phosphate kinase